MKLNLWKLIFSIVVCQLAGVIGSLFTSSSISTWYTALRKPFFNPPNWIFGPVWITLYLLMGISLYLVWNTGIEQKYVKVAIIVFIVQFVLNSLWSILFFGLQSPFLAFVEILVLWATILLTIVFFFRISVVAGWLLIPYIIWVSFAAVLNGAIWLLN